MLGKMDFLMSSSSTSFFSISYANSYLPPSWIIAYIVPVVKKGDLSNHANYRPTSLTSSRKVMERVINDELGKSLLVAGRIPPHRHAFITKHFKATDLLKETYDGSILL